MLEKRDRSSLSYRIADPGEPVLESSVGDALRTAASIWPSRVALIGEPWTTAPDVAGLSRSCWRNPKKSHVRFCFAFPGEHVAVWSAMARNSSSSNSARLLPG